MFGVSGYGSTQVKLTGSAVRKVTFALRSTKLSIVQLSKPEWDARYENSCLCQKLSKIEFRPRGLESANVRVDSYLQKKYVNKEF
jgi:hypothetical protein